MTEVLAKIDGKALAVFQRLVMRFILPQGSRLGVVGRGMADALLVVQGVKTGLGSPEIEDRRGPDVDDGLEPAVLSWEVGVDLGGGACRGENGNGRYCDGYACC